MDTVIRNNSGEKIDYSFHDSESEMVVWENGGHLHNIENPKEFNMKTLEFMLR